MDRTEVLIVGAGPTGLTLACGLLAQGVAVRVVDRAAGPATTSRANILHARGVEVLDRIGVSGDHLPRTVAASSMSLYAGTRRLATMRFRDIKGTRLSALFVSQADIEGVLRDRLAELGGTIAWGTELTGLLQDGDGVTATLADGTEVRARWVTGCDGAHSTVRKLAGVAFPGVSVVERFLLADVYADWPRDRTGSHAWFHRDGVLLALPMRGRDEGPGKLWRLMADVTALDEGARPARGTREGEGTPPGGDTPPDGAAIMDTFRRLLPERAAEQGVRIHRAEWTSVFRIHRRLAERYRDGRVLLAGDAAHIHSPVGGQGVVTGMGDAENLAWKLALVAHGHADAALLDTYTAERRPLAAEVLQNTTAQTRLLLGETLPRRVLRDLVFLPIANLPSVQRRGTAIASQLWVTYRGGPLGGASRFARGLRPGDRVPDRPCVRADGERVRLYATLREGWALLGPATAVADAVTGAEKRLGTHCAALTPADGAQSRKGKVPADGEVWLVRPDGHLAWRGAADTGGVGRWLEHLTRRGRIR